MRLVALIIAIFLKFSNIVYSQNRQFAKKEIVNINISEILKYSSVKRDDFFKKNLNKLIVAKGYVENIEKKNFLNKEYRIVIIYKNLIRKINIIFHVYTSNKNFFLLLKKGNVFEFKGQFVMYTPLNSKRTSYILDILLEEGAVVIE